jgi:hypothetical protein
MRALRHLAVALSFVSTSCTSPPPAPSTDSAPPCSLQLQWGHKEAGAFIAFKDGDEAKITLGFQGFRFIDSVARITVSPPAAPSSANFRMQTTLDTREPTSQDAGPFDAKVGPDGALYVEGLLLFFNDTPLPDLIGLTAAVVVVAEAGGCRGTAHATVKLLRGGCMDRDGGTSCNDGGV